MVSVHGWLLLDKPAGISSAAAVAKVKSFFGVKRVGHAGTLDPFATGLLPIAIGEATKTTRFLNEDAAIGIKGYEFLICWGQATDTLDCDGTITEQEDKPPPSPEAIQAVLDEFIGEIKQIPPIYSALKIDGKRAYHLARQGTPVTPQARTIRIDRLKWLGTDEQGHSRFVCDCSKGTYIRALARDIGTRLGHLCHTSALRRVQVESFSINHAIMLEELEKLLHKDAAFNPWQESIKDKTWFLPVDAVLDGIPALIVNDGEMAMLKLGRAIAIYRPCDHLRRSGLNQDSLVIFKLQNKSTQSLKTLGWGIYAKGMVKPVKLLQH